MTCTDVENLGMDCAASSDGQQCSARYISYNRYAQLLEPIQQLVQKILEKKLCHILAKSEKSEEDICMLQSIRSYWIGAYDVCHNLYMNTVKDLLRNLDVPLDVISRAVDETYCRTIQSWLGKQEMSPLEILQWVKKNTESSLYRMQNKRETQVPNETQGNRVSQTQITQDSYLQVYQQLVEENPIATRLEDFLLQHLQYIADIDTESYEKLGVYQLEQQWLQWISVMLETCAQMEDTKFSKLTQWLWKHLSYDPIHPLVQSSLALAISKTKNE